MQTLTEEKSIENGGPAYPHCFEDISGHPSWRQSQGMSLRDWFAGQALAGLMASYAIATIDPTEAKDERARKARSCYALADAMLAAREG